MSSLLDMLTQHVGGDTVSNISGQTGLDPSTVSSITAAALPMLVGALARNASTDQGAASLASALSNDHDGSLLDNLPAFLGSGGAAAAGAGILGHLFGNKQGSVAASVGQATGADSAQVLQVISMLAPIVMGALGRAASQQSAPVSNAQAAPSITTDGLSQVLAQAQSSLGSQVPGGLGALASMLDSNHDGSVFDDLSSLASKFLNPRA